MADVKKLAEELVNLTVKEVNELATVLKEEYGIEPAAAAVAVAAPAAGAGEAAAAEKTSFDVILKNAGQSKLQVIKVVKEIAGLSLGDARRWSTVLPRPLRRVSPRRRLSRSRASSRRQALKLKSSSFVTTFVVSDNSGVEFTPKVSSMPFLV